MEDLERILLSKITLSCPIFSLYYYYLKNDKCERLTRIILHCLNIAVSTV